MLVSLLAALAAAVCYGFGAVLQAMAVRAASRRGAVVAGAGGAGVDPGLLVRLLHQGPFVAGVVIDLAGFVAQLIALRRLPLFAVQAITASNLAVAAVCAAWLMKVRLSRREWLAVAGVVVGVGLLGMSAGAQGAARPSTSFKIGLVVAVVAVGLSGLAAARLRNPVRTPVLGAIAGLGYGTLATSARILPGFGAGQLLRSPATYTLAAAGVLSFVLYATALEGGSVTTATAAVVLVETTLPAIAGIAFLGDRTDSGKEAVAAVGFLLAVLCAIALARFGETPDTGLQADQPGQVGEDDRPPDRRAA